MTPFSYHSYFNALHKVCDKIIHILIIEYVIEIKQIPNRFK